MARRNSVSLASHRPLHARLKPVAQAAAQAVMLMAVWSTQHDVHAGTLAVRMAQPYARVTSVTTNLTAPGASTLPSTVVNLKDANGNAQNIAKSGNVTGAITGTTLDLTQTTERSIVLFNSFDIGSQAAVKVLFGSSTSTALYQITSSTAPSQIYGSLSSSYKDSNGTLQTGGEIFLINPNGILFGKGAQVNVGGLFASTLNVDEADYKSGLTNSINGTGATFKWVSPDGIATYAPENAFVKVDAGANISTASGGRVFLLGGQVENAGSVSTPNGQTVLAAGSEVYLSSPTGSATTLYMSEANDKVPTVKGLLVEVNGSRTDSEFATNSGSISTPTGNATIVGWAVNQMGRVSATTSVTQNGSVYLTARSGTSDTGTTTKKATMGGTLTLGANSTVSITPDTTPDASGNAVTTNANAVFTASRVEMSGKAINFESGASVVAPGATVNVRASSVPVYLATEVGDVGVVNDDGTGTISVASGAKIDVSGSTDTTVSAARNFVTTALLGAQDLKDAPLQKDGPVYRSKLTFDIRSGAPILGDTSAYTNAVQKTAGEFMATGGNVVLSATGKVDVAKGALINVSGGTVRYTDALVTPSILVAEDGQRYTLNTAPSDVKYTAIAGQETGTATRFGTVGAGTTAPLGRVESGYTDGKSAGSISVYAPLAHVDGAVRGSVTTGARQKAGLDALATAGTLRLGTASNVVGSTTVAIGAKDFVTSVMQDLVIANDTSTVGDDVSRIAAGTVQDGGFGNVQFTADKRITQQAGAKLKLANQSTVKLQSNGQVTLGADIVTHGGTILAAVYDKDVNSTVSSGVTLQSGAKLDVSGNWVNQRLDGTTTAAAVAGGKVTLKSDHSLAVEQGSNIDVSGGVTVSTAGAFAGTAAGGITLEGLNASSLTGSEQVSIGGTLKGYSLGKGGSLRIKAGSILIDGNGSAIAQNGDAGLKLGSGFFSTGGFQSFDLDGRTSLTLNGGTSITPTLQVWQALSAGRGAATGSDTATFMTPDKRAETVRNSVNISLASSGSEQGAGALTLATSSVIDTGPQATIALKAGHTIDIDGTVHTLGGTVTAAVKAGQSDNDASSHINLGKNAKLDVSGGGVFTTVNNGRINGKVVDGGSIALTVSKANAQSDASIDVASGAQLLADGGTAVLDVARVVGDTGAAYTRKTVASNGGSIAIQTGSGGARLAGTLSAKGGNVTATGGTLSLQLGQLDTNNRSSDQSSGAYALNVQSDAVSDAAPVVNQLTLSTKTVTDGGFANLNLSSLDAVNFKGNVTLVLPQHLVIDAPVISATPGSGVLISAASSVQLGSSQNLTTLPAATGGDAHLTVNGGIVELYGSQATQGFNQVTLNSGSELRLRGLALNNTARSTGAFNTAADLTVNAQQVTPTSASSYTINSTGDVTFGKGNASATPVLSAQASLTVNAKTIHQNGVLRSPFGKINLHATDALVVGAGSVTSVSGEGMLVPYGATTDAGGTWQYNGVTQTSLQGKSITLDANGQTVSTEAGATLNLNGGGQLLAYEFIPGPGGSKDIFAGQASGAFAIVPAVTGYSPYDAQIMLGNGATLTQNPSTGNILSLGNTITIGAGAMVPAGTYTIVPARYALLPGAYLVKANTSVSNVGLGYVQTKADGSQVVAGVLGTNGVGKAGNAVASAYTVMSSAQARAYSEVKGTDLDTYLTKNATLAGTAAGALSRDAGHLSLKADQLTLDAKVLMGVGTGGRGGLLDIAAAKVHVGGTADSSAGVLNLSADQINNTGATSILIGGVRDDADDKGVSVVTVVADQVTVDKTSNKVIAVGDLTLAAKNTVTVNDGVRIEAPAATASTGDAPSLTINGDGALLRVSSSTNAQTTRTGATRAQGTLTMGNGLSLKGGSITAEGTAASSFSNAVQSTTSTIQAQSLTLGASRIEVGTGAGSATGTDAPLVLTDALAKQLQNVQNLTLRSYSTVDMLGTSQIGSSGTAKLTVDTAGIRVIGDQASAKLQAGQVTLSNTTGSTLSADAGTGSLNVIATGLQGGNGHVTIGSGNVAVSGVQRTDVQAAGSVVLSGNGGLTVPGDLNLSAQSLTASAGAQSQLTASGGTLAINPATLTGGTAATAGAGASVTLNAANINHSGRIDLPSGKLVANADQSVQFGAKSSTNLAGYSKTIDNVTLTTMGGALQVNAAAGDISLAQGSVVDVSAASGGASTAGSMSFNAANGSVALQGRLVATSAAGQTGGSLTVDSQNALSVGDLAQRISAENTGSLSNFAKTISLRNRSGDQAVAQGTTLQAQSLSLSADQGSLTVNGQLLANGSAAGGNVQLSAGNDVVLGSTANIQAKATGAGKGGQVAMASTSGNIRLQGGSIDTSGAGADNGSLSLRAARNGADVNVDAIDTALTGVKQVNVEAVKVYNKTTVKDADITTMKSEAVTYLDGNTGTIASKLTSGQAGLTADKLHLRAGVEVRSAGDLTLNTTNTKSGISLNSSAASGEPINLTIRAGGNLNVAASISSGFSTTTAAGVPQAGLGSNITLVAGADMKSANVTSTVASDTRGDLNIGTASGSSVIVRSTTGDIKLAAGRDINLLNAAAVVYTTGTQVTSTTGYTKPTGTGVSTVFGNTLSNPFLNGGGSINLDAQRDVAWLQTGTQQTVTDWAYRFKAKSASNQISWWNRYDLFKQGVATMGGGDVSINAGRDAWNVNAFTANSGYVSSVTGQSVTYGGGNLNLSAGRDVVSGMLGATQNLQVTAGRDVSMTRTDNTLGTTNTPVTNLTVLLGDGSNRVLARNNLQLDAVTLVGRLSPVKESTSSTVNQQQVPAQLYRPMDSASLELASTAGDLNVNNASSRTIVLPAQATISAAGGTVSLDAEPTMLGDVVGQLAGPATRLNLLASGDVTVGSITQSAADATVTAVTVTAPTSGSNLSGAGSSPTRIVSDSGSVTYAGAIKLTTPLHLIAGKDINASSQLSNLVIQNQKATDVSLIQAGRDFNLSNAVPAFGVEVRGPGDLLIVTGRSTDLKASTGVVATGNLNNPNLTKGSANVTLLSGVSFVSGDVSDAVAAGYPLLDGQGMGAQAALLLKQLNGGDGSSYSGDQWLDKARALAGDATYQSLAWAFVNHREDATLSQTDAVAQVASLSSADKVKLAGQVLAKAWSQTVSADQQSSTVLALADASSARAVALMDFVAVRTGQKGLTLAQSWQAFKALPVAQQALLVTKTLSADVSAAITDAASKTGASRDAAYAKGYDALSTVFNHATSQAGNISLSSSQVKTLQGSAVSVFTPNGGVNVGQLSATALNSRGAADLGIVTAAGGDVNVLVRDDVAVNTSRVFTLVKGDEVIWSSLGNVDAGRGAKTATATPTPVYYIDDQGLVQVDISSAISGNGISATGTAHIAAPKGEINAGDAGISATKGLDLAAQVIRGADAISAPSVRGAPPAAAVNLAASVAPPVQPAAGPGDSSDKEDKDKKRRRKRNLLLEFLGFGVEGA